MAFGQESLQPFPPGQGLRDYTHASKTFRTGGYDLAPRTKFLFYVYFIGIGWQVQHHWTGG
jgi:hypothetical protein